MDSVSHQLLKVKFPPEKWCTLAQSLSVASAVSKIEANHRDVERKLLAVISHWVKSTTQHNQWITLVEAVIMCDECGVAEQLATAVGVEYTPPPSHSGMLHVTMGCIYVILIKNLNGVSLSEPHTDHDNRPAHGIQLCMNKHVSLSHVFHIIVPEIRICPKVLSLFLYIDVVHVRDFTTACTHRLNSRTNGIWTYTH